MRVLVTGAAGFVGSHLITHLRERSPDAELVALFHPDAPPAATLGEDIRQVACDLLAEEGKPLAKVMREISPDIVYHLAGFASGAGTDREIIIKTNVDGTRFMLEACAAVPTPPHLLFTSTGYVYGACDKHRPPTENDPPASDGAGGVYAESKILAEQETIPYRAFTLTTRAFNHTGPGQAPAFVVPGFARQIAHIERGDAPAVMKVGNLQAERDFLDVRDVVRAYVLLMERGTMGETYNVCSGNTITIQSVLDRLRALSQVETQVEQDPARMRPSDIPVSVGDPFKLKQATGWEPTVPFDTTLRDTLTYWRSQH